MSWFRWQGEQLLIDIRLQPRASRNEVVGALGERLKIRLTAPPVDGKANGMLLRYVAELCDVPLAQVSLVRGETSRDKTVAIRNPRTLPPGVTDKS